MHHPLGAAIKLGWNSLRQRSNLRDAHLTFSCLRSWKKRPLVTAPARRDQGNVAAPAKFLSPKVTSSKQSFDGRDDAASRSKASRKRHIAVLSAAGCGGAGTPRAR